MSHSKTTTSIDYRLLLIKYINMVGDIEGVSFINPKDKPDRSKFKQELLLDVTPDEYEELIELDKESSRLWKTKLDESNL